MPKRKQIQRLPSGAELRQDARTGLSWAVDRAGKMRACHPFRRHKRGSHMQYASWGWNPGDRIISCSGFIFNTEIYEAGSRIESEIGSICSCVGCIFRRDQSMRLSSVRRLLLAVMGLHRQELLSRHTGRYNTIGWDPHCQICSRAIKAAERHGLELPDPHGGNIDDGA